MDKRKPAEPPRTRTRVELNKSRKSSMEMNLLGYTVDEALNEVVAIGHGMLRGQNTLYIIHGNGTGALRTAIQKHLRTHKAADSFLPRPLWRGRKRRNCGGIKVKIQNNPVFLSMAIIRHICYAKGIMMGV